MAIIWLKAQGRKEKQCIKGPAHNYDYGDYSHKEIRELRDDRRTRRLPKTGVATTMVCRRMCDNHHYSLEEEEIQPLWLLIQDGQATRKREPLRHYD